MVWASARPNRAAGVSQTLPAAPTSATKEVAVADAPFAMPDRIAIDAKGYGWRVWDDQEFWSMVPTNPDNSPIPQPVKWFIRLLAFSMCP